MGVIVNPQFISSYNNLKSACMAYKAAEQRYGKGSKEAHYYAVLRAQAENIWCNQKGTIEDKNSNMTGTQADNIVNSMMGEVRSWYA